jgi:hypothetical protein
MTSDWTQYFEIHDLIFIGVILLLFGAIGGGPILKALVPWFLKVFGRGTETTININQPGGEMAGKLKPTPCASCTITDPSSCPLHQSEHERSMRNEKGIEALWTHYGDMRKEMTAGFKEVTATVIQSQQAILAAIGKRPKDWKDKNHGGGGGFES